MRLTRLAFTLLIASFAVACQDTPLNVAAPDDAEGPQSEMLNPTSIFYTGPQLKMGDPTNGPQLASQLGQPVPDAVIVSAAGLEWVWASPCTDLRYPAGRGCSLGIDVGHDGFNYATDEQWAVHPSIDAFLNEDGSVKCASPWFEHAYDHCDWWDAVNGFYGSSPDWQTGPNGGSRHPNAETWLVRVADPKTKDDCKDGGWEKYGFKNQGQCVRFIETGKDSR